MHVDVDDGHFLAPGGMAFGNGVHGPRRHVVEDAEPAGVAALQQPRCSGVMSRRSYYAESVAVASHQHLVHGVLHRSRGPPGRSQAANGEGGIAVLLHLGFGPQQHLPLHLWGEGHRPHLGVSPLGLFPLAFEILGEVVDESEVLGRVDAGKELQGGLVEVVADGDLMGVDAAGVLDAGEDGADAVGVFPVGFGLGDVVAAFGVVEDEGATLAGDRQEVGARGHTVFVVAGVGLLFIVGWIGSVGLYGGVRGGGGRGGGIGSVFGRR
mmetsp:Transcript_40372/g.94859  ORF Transcript_40372/g.94859 Transcript_40372/m.94859 type:complete len:267 (+) Transcript_40372:1121-1921(+)